MSFVCKCRVKCIRLNTCSNDRICDTKLKIQEKSVVKKLTQSGADETRLSCLVNFHYMTIDVSIPWHEICLIKFLSRSHACFCKFRDLLTQRLKF